MAESSGSGGGFGDSFFIVGIVALLFLAWSSGMGTPGGERRASDGRVSYPIVTTRSSSVSTGRETPPRELTPEEQARLLQEAEEARSRSAYRGLVTIVRSATAARRTDPALEYVRISLSSRATEPVSISGWTILSTVTERQATIPQGVELPLSGVIVPSAPIVLRPGDSAYLITGRSPLGASFRTNMCMGYFSRYQRFEPSLGLSCPAALSTAERFSGIDFNRDEGCYDFLRSIPRCSIVTGIPPTVSASCAGFVETNIHYNGCVRLYQNESAFYGSQWRVYLGRTGELWRRDRETIRLLDAEGKTVDQYSY